MCSSFRKYKRRRRIDKYRFELDMIMKRREKEKNGKYVWFCYACKVAQMTWRHFLEAELKENLLYEEQHADSNKAEAAAFTMNNIDLIESSNCHWNCRVQILKETRKYKLKNHHHHHVEYAACCQFTISSTKWSRDNLFKNTKQNRFFLPFFELAT